MRKRNLIAKRLRLLKTQILFYFESNRAKRNQTLISLPDLPKTIE